MSLAYVKYYKKGVLHMGKAIGVRRSSSNRADLIASELKIGRSLVETILRKDRELRKQELLTYGTTSIVGLCTLTATPHPQNGELMVRSRVSNALLGSLLNDTNVRYSTEELPKLEEVLD